MPEVIQPDSVPSRNDARRLQIIGEVIGQAFGMGVIPVPQEWLTDIVFQIANGNCLRWMDSSEN